ncbi:DUF1491 family protein [Parasphingopyxis lamellibrachiae]|uniref:DUF1491 family protein n=1 Tax=Parasphingopyxis lamellibrachiae TaxID=680125 RepID=A0A3D9FH39_9SPHN|nr:DUF1491 family protein [Parasphingopyxis lamellibrachiae]RED17105.1 hypothetical protein DFR46_2141 [Parasphingopyxis lamellibrachiae]
MSGRITSKVLIGALRRRVEAAGGHAMVLSKGDEISGAVLLALADRGTVRGLRERGLAPDGSYRWVEAGPDDIGDPQALADYLERRRKFDPDIWVVEIDLDEPEAWLADFIGAA